MDEIVTEHVGSILRVQLNRPTKRNAMTSAIYIALAGIFSEAANDENTRVILWHGAGDSFCAGNDISKILQDRANRRRLQCRLAGERLGARCFSFQIGQLRWAVQ